MDERVLMSCIVCGDRKDCAAIHCNKLPSGAPGCGVLLVGICDGCWRDDPIALADKIMAHDVRKHQMSPLIVYVVAVDPIPAEAVELVTEVLQLAKIHALAGVPGTSVKMQLREADNLKAQFVLIVAPDEYARGKAILRSFAWRISLEIDIAVLVPSVRAVMSVYAPKT